MVYLSKYLPSLGDDAEGGTVFPDPDAGSLPSRYLGADYRYTNPDNIGSCPSYCETTSCRTLKRRQ